jgi:hypothetical protein
MVVHLFLALTVSIRRRLLFPTLCWSINTKSMGLSIFWFYGCVYSISIFSTCEPIERNRKVSLVKLILEFNILTYIPLTLDARRGNRSDSDIPARRPILPKWLFNKMKELRGILFYFCPGHHTRLNHWIWITLFKKPHQYPSGSFKDLSIHRHRQPEATLFYTVLWVVG